MSDRTGFARIVAEDLPHAGIGLVIEGLCLLLALAGAPLLVAGLVGIPLATAVGYVRELIQMLRSGDTGFGRSRARDMLGFTAGAVLGYTGGVIGGLL